MNNNEGGWLGEWAPSRWSVELVGLALWGVVAAAIVGAIAALEGCESKNRARAEEVYQARAAAAREYLGVSGVVTVRAVLISPSGHLAAVVESEAGVRRTVAVDPPSVPLAGERWLADPNPAPAYFSLGGVRDNAEPVRLLRRVE